MSPARSLFLALLFLGGCSGGDPYTVEERRIPLALGADTVDLVVFGAEAPGRTYINLHDDEQTSVDAALEVLREEGGRVFELQHGGERNISFTLEGTVHVFDPNRMFTDGGAMLSLATLSSSTPEAFGAVRAFADEVLRHYDLPGLEAVITLHNTSADRYTVRSYLPGGAYETQAEAVHVGERHDPSDYFFVTTPSLYQGLREEDYNVVLQDNARATDDGSLSVYCADAGLPYANAEALHGHREVQQEMLLGLGQVLEELTPP